jgi:hypothetical protein
MRVPFSHIGPIFVVVFVLDDSLLTGVRENLNVVLICISFTAQDVEQFFLYLLAI